MKDLKKLAIVAGAGTLPVLVAENAISKGINVVTIAFAQDTFDKMKRCSSKIYLFGIGQAGKVLKTLKDEGVRDLIMIGKFEKKMLFQNMKFDLKALGILSRIKDRNDDTIMLAIVEEFKKAGVNVLDQKEFLTDIIPKAGVLTEISPSKDEYEDIEYGFDIAKKIAGLDIGQTVVVKNKTILAIEAIEGTDEAIKRGSALAVEGAVVVKVAKPFQDARFDLPTVGVNTLKAMNEGKAKVIAVEAEKTFMPEIGEVLSLASQYGIAIVAVK